MFTTASFVLGIIGFILGYLFRGRALSRTFDAKNRPKEASHLGTNHAFAKLELPDTITSLKGLPSTIAWLLVRNNRHIKNLEGTPGSVKGIGLVQCRALKNLKGLPEGIEVVGLSCCEQLTSLAGLPQSVKHLMIVDCPNASSAGLPSQVTVSTVWDERLLSPTSEAIV